MQNTAVFPALIGNDRFKKIVGEDILHAKLMHAYILEGPAGSGKHTAALSAAAALSCPKKTSGSLPCGTCISCRKIMGQISPDVIVVRRDEGKASIGVDAIRRLREDLWIAPNENEKKVYIIENAESMTLQAQNALLLSLEEPPPFAVFFLLTEDAVSLLETVRSRAPVLRMQRFDEETIADILKRDPKFARISSSDPDFFAEAVAASDGAIGKARLFLYRSDPDSAEYLSLRGDAVRFAQQLFSSDFRTSAEILQNLPKEREDVYMLLRLTVSALRDLIALKRNASVPLLLYTSKEECRELLNKTSMSRIVCAYDDVLQSADDIQANASIETVCASLLMKKY